VTLGLAQKATELIRQTSPDALWTADTSLLSSLPFVGADLFLIYSYRFILSAHTFSEICGGRPYLQGDNIFLEKQSRVQNPDQISRPCLANLGARYSFQSPLSSSTNSAGCSFRKLYLSKRLAGNNSPPLFAASLPRC